MSAWRHISCCFTFTLWTIVDSIQGGVGQVVAKLHERCLLFHYFHTYSQTCYKRDFFVMKIYFVLKIYTGLDIKLLHLYYFWDAIHPHTGVVSGFILHLLPYVCVCLPGDLRCSWSALVGLVCLCYFLFCASGPICCRFLNYVLK